LKNSSAEFTLVLAQEDLLKQPSADMYKYTIAALFFVGSWCVLFALAPKSRKPILWSSLAWGHAGPISQYWHLKDYWNPTFLVTFRIDGWMFGIEDYLFAFSFAGLCTGVFDILVRRMGAEALSRFNFYGFMILSLLGLCCVVSMATLIPLFHINSLYAISLAFMVCALFILFRKPKWIASALLTALGIGVLMWFGYWVFIFRLFPEILSQWWNPKALSGISLAGVPIEEVAWAFVTALFVGPAVRYCMGSLVNRHLFRSKP
jgi:hypothetical protein